jgi:hypothetical protein
MALSIHLSEWPGQSQFALLDALLSLSLEALAEEFLVESRIRSLVFKQLWYLLVFLYPKLKALITIVNWLGPTELLKDSISLFCF